MEEKLPSIPPRTNKEDIILFLLIAIVLSTVLLARLSG
jgi:nitrate reductase NapE component